MKASFVCGPCRLAVLLPIVAVVFIAFLVIGLVLPVLPLHGHQGLGLGPFGTNYGDSPYLSPRARCATVKVMPREECRPRSS